MVKSEKKTCSKCQVVKPISEFYTQKTPRKSGFHEYVRPECKACMNKANAAWRKANREKINAQVRANYHSRKQGTTRKRQTYEEFKAKKTKYVMGRYHSEPAFKLMMNLRRRVRLALEGNSKSAATQALLGCTVDELLKHLEAQFTEGMTHDNIDVDHIVPCASFNLEDPQQQRRCFHFSNLQPLFPTDNQSKGAKTTERAANREWNGTMWVDKV